MDPELENFEPKLKIFDKNNKFESKKYFVKIQFSKYEWSYYNNYMCDLKSMATIFFDWRGEILNWLKLNA